MNNDKRIELVKSEDGKQLVTKIFSIFQSFFKTKYSKNRIQSFTPTNDLEEIKKRFDFIEECINLPYEDIDIKEIELPWHSVKNICFLTSDYENYRKLIEIYKGFPIFYVESNRDLSISVDYLQVRSDNWDIVNLIPHAVYTKEPFPEFHIERLVKVKELLLQIKDYLSEELKNKIELLSKFSFEFPNAREEVINEIEIANKELTEEIKSERFEGETILNLLQGTVRDKLRDLINKKIEKIENNLIKKGITLDLSFIEPKIPLDINETLFSKSISEFESKLMLEYFEKVNELFNIIGNSDEFLEKVKSEIYELDFRLGIKKIVKFFNLKKPEFTNKGFSFSDGKNIFLLYKGINVEPVNYDVDVDGILLTGANSGGKTSLLELIFQIHFLASIGFYVPANSKISLYDEIYYFSKPTGKTDSGAFETLLKKFSKINSSKKKLILADEIEAITEPGAAAKIIVGIMNWFIERNSLII
ncbi:MAG: hypothetical protein QW524_02350, partial [Candidatus Woesearchaeota archaeon]